MGLKRVVRFEAGTIGGVLVQQHPANRPGLTGLAATVVAGLLVRVTGCLAVASGGVHMTSEIWSQRQEACGIA